MPDISADRYASIARFVTNTDRNVFALRNLPEEVAAVLFAYYSRSPDSLRDNLLKLLDEGDLEVGGELANSAPPLAQAQEKARAFHEKWVVGYGHGSVAEHAVVKLAVENVSILASKLIEDVRLASFTEKSTRYVKFDPTKTYTPESVRSNPRIFDAYRERISSLMETYSSWLEPVYEEVKARTPKTEKQTPRGYESALRATTFDILRYLLPTATYTNIGMTINARSLEGLITKLSSQPLPEGRDLGAQIKAEAMHEVPTLLKYADPSIYRSTWADVAAKPVGEKLNKNGVRLVGPYFNEAQALDLVASPRAGSDLDLVTMLSERGKHDPTPRELERVSLTFEITMDYGAYRDVQRHRMATFVTETLTPNYGYEIPSQLVEFGYEQRFQEQMDKAADTYNLLSDSIGAAEAAYVLPLAFRVRTRMTANLRELFHFIELRTGRGGHPSYRKIALDVYKHVETVYPRIAEFIRPNKGAFGLTRE